MTKHKTSKKSLLEYLLAKNSPLSWRSLFAFVAILATSTTLLCFAKIQSAEWVGLIEWIGGVFITGEAARKFVNQSSSTTEISPAASQEAGNS